MSTTHTTRAAPWSWEWTPGLAYRMRNTDWPQDVFAAVVDDFGCLVIVAWWAE